MGYYQQAVFWQDTGLRFWCQSFPAEWPKLLERLISGSHDA